MIKSKIVSREKMSIKYEIYYFTGTGNSLFIARKLAKLLNSTIESIPKAISLSKEVKTGPNIIMVFPSYLAMIYGIPVIVKEFVENIPDISSKTIVAVCSCGGYEMVNAVPSVRFLEKIIKTRGGNIFDYYTMRLPMNNLDYEHIPIPIEKNEKVIISKTEKKIKKMASDLQKGRKHCIKKFISNIIQILMSPLYALLKEVGHKPMLKIAKETEDSEKSIEEIFRLTDRSISADQHCVGCGICAKVCPVQNIKIESKHPVWLHHCEMCFACHEWCPQKAIHHWGRKDGVYYHNPEVSLQDFIQKC